MKRIIALVATLFLVGCSTTVPVKMSFPQAPQDLLQACENLQDIDPKTEKLSDVVKTVSQNYGLYNDCKIKSDGWIQWYNTQKKIFEEVK